MRAFSFFTISSRRRCRKLGERALAILRAEEGSRAHSHIFWLGLAGLGFLVAQGGAAGWYVAPGIALFCGLSVIVVFDIEYLIIPDGPLLFLFATGLLTTLLGAPGELWSRLVCALAAWAGLSLFAAAYERWRGFPGLGAADPTLFAIAGLWLGFQALPGCLLVAALSGLLSAASLTRERHLTSANQLMPFGPHLALAIWLAWTFGPLEGG
jgi:leader peptidase (prepilin peptidase) / N-methyltransferase